MARLAEVFVLVLALALALYALRALIGFEYGLDQGIYAVVSDALLEGGAPYRDAWDFKPPGIYFVYALARGVLGHGMQAVRVFEALGLASLVPAFAVLSRRFVGSALPGLFGGSLAVAAHAWLGFWATAQPESFGAILTAWALVLATAESADARRQWCCWAAAGALYTLAGLMKPQLGGGVLVSWAFVAGARWRRDGVAMALPPTLAFGAGGLATLGLTLLFFGAHGALGDLGEALFVFAPGYTEINHREQGLLVHGFRSVEFLLFRFSLLNPTGLVLLFALPSLAPREREGAAHVLGIVAMHLVGIALQGRFFPYHYGATLPLVGLLAGWGLWKLTRVGRRAAIGSALLLGVLALLLNANAPKGEVEGSVLERIARFDDGRAYNVPQRRVAAWVASHTEPDDRIFVWGFAPVVYDLADRRPASRYVYNAPQRARWFAARGRRRLLEDLEARPPAAVLVESQDVHPGTMGNGLDSQEVLRRFPPFARWLAAHYRPAETVGVFTIHLRREAAGRPAPAPPGDRGRSGDPSDPGASP